MQRRSLRRRLLALAVVTIIGALGLAWLALTLIFERYMRDQIETQLAQNGVWIATNLDWQGGAPRLAVGPPDPRFDRPFGGFYWQVDGPGSESLRSRSLWDASLPPAPAAVSSFDATGPRGGTVLVTAQRFTIPAPAGGGEISVLVAANHSEIEEPVKQLGEQLAIALTIIGGALLAAAMAQVALGLAPLDALRAEIVAVRRRQKSRLGEDVPQEVGPLIDEVNELLSAQDDAIGRARAQAGDLAHGLKTPLTLLAHLAPDLARAGQESAAREIEAQVRSMRRRIDRQLARARLGSGRFATSRLDLLVDRLISLLQRTEHGAGLDWINEVEAQLTVPADEVDVAEIVGNLLDNACKWAKGVVLIRASAEAGHLTLSVEDDGPGVPDGELEAIRKRGHKLEEAKEGSGLGLAIVDDLITAYGGAIAIRRSDLGGLKVEVSFPLAPKAEAS